MPKNIILLADGTGNSSGKIARTNVWDTYQALDLQSKDPNGSPAQIAYYHDGVGTSSFQPFALLGGAFGWGLKRNILDLYRFVCRNYEPGDRIYAFGFSRGAFTVRVLAGLIAAEGVCTGLSEAGLAREASAIYREYRKRDKTRSWFVRAARALRDLFSHKPRTNPNARRQPKIAFLGVWDTVAAYGMPIAELTRAIDKYIWPLSMPNYHLSEKVECARHAIGLDDERETFHPLLWDEHHEADLLKFNKISPSRLKQVWFAGMHSDVGGGYPDNALAAIPLNWMLDEACAVGLKFNGLAREALKNRLSISGLMHDSRRGLGGYYRYQPRYVSIWLKPPSNADTAVLRDPSLNYGLLTNAVIHHSVFDRIKYGIQKYAPVGLPDAYDMLDATGKSVSGPEHLPEQRSAAQRRIWHRVFWKRLNYFGTLAASLFLVAMPALLSVPPFERESCAGPFCLLAPAIRSAGIALPGAVQPWIDAFADSPVLFLAAAGFGVAFLSWGARIQQAIREDMHKLWQASLADNVSGITPSIDAINGSAIARLRHRPAYQMIVQTLKWRGTAALLGRPLQFLAVGVPILFLLMTIYRGAIAVQELRGDFCRSSDGGWQVFETKARCADMAATVEDGGHYRVTISVGEPWSDDVGKIPTTPQGFTSDRFSFLTRLGAWSLSRSITDRWFQPIVQIVPEHGLTRSIALEMQRLDASDVVYYADFVAPSEGRLYLFVNDALPFPPIAPDPYGNNRGTACVDIRSLDAIETPARCAAAVAKGAGIATRSVSGGGS